MAGEITDELNLSDNGEKEFEKDENEQSEQNGSTTDKLVKLPISRIRRIIKTDPDVSLTSQEAMVVLTKATELFVQHLSREAVVYTFQGKRKTIQRKDLDCAVDRTDSLAFLDDFARQKVPLNDQFNSYGTYKVVPLGGENVTSGCVHVNGKFWTI